jgi:ribosomal protein S18 acetylase RimI-like enzyme
VNLEVTIADYSNKKHSKDIAYLLNIYAKDPMGGGKDLSDDIKNSIVLELSKRVNNFSIIAYINSEPIGLAVCFENFSTFICKPLINIHDIIIIPKARGLGISQKILAKVEDEAIKRGCCKITLEVLEGNIVARNAYKKFGFEGYELDPKVGKALFWQKSI